MSPYAATVLASSSFTPEPFHLDSCDDEAKSAGTVEMEESNSDHLKSPPRGRGGGEGGLRREQGFRARPRKTSHRSNPAYDDVKLCKSLSPPDCTMTALCSPPRPRRSLLTPRRLFARLFCLKDTNAANDDDEWNYRATKRAAKDTDDESNHTTDSIPVPGMSNEDHNPHQSSTSYETCICSDTSESSLLTVFSRGAPAATGYSDKGMLSRNSEAMMTMDSILVIPECSDLQDSISSLNSHPYWPTTTTPTTPPPVVRNVKACSIVPPPSLAYQYSEWMTRQYAENQKEIMAAEMRAAAYPMDVDGWRNTNPPMPPNLKRAPSPALLKDDCLYDVAAFQDTIMTEAFYDDDIQDHHHPCRESLKPPPAPKWDNSDEVDAKRFLHHYAAAAAATAAADDDDDEDAVPYPDSPPRPQRLLIEVSPGYCVLMRGGASEMNDYLAQGRPIATQDCIACQATVHCMAEHVTIVLCPYCRVVQPILWPTMTTTTAAAAAGEASLTRHHELQDGLALGFSSLDYACMMSQL